jgi:hypothetical protein
LLFVKKNLCTGQKDTFSLGPSASFTTFVFTALKFILNIFVDKKQVPILQNITVSLWIANWKNYISKGDQRYEKVHQIKMADKHYPFPGDHGSGRLSDDQPGRQDRHPRPSPETVNRL